jgi:hypothetical protein
MQSSLKEQVSVVRLITYKHTGRLLAIILRFSLHFRIDSKGPNGGLAPGREAGLFCDKITAVLFRLLIQGFEGVNNGSRPRLLTRHREDIPLKLVI